MKKILSTLLALCMVLSLIVAVPFTASAEEATGADQSKVGYKDVTATYDEDSYPALESVTNPEGVTAAAYTVGSVAGLRNFATLVAGGATFEGVTVYLINDVDFSAATAAGADDATKIADSLFAGIGAVGAPFKGTFDGQGFTLKNFTLRNETNATLGFFNETRNATIKNVKLVTTQGDKQSYNAPYSVQTFTSQQQGNLGQGTLVGGAFGSLTVVNVYNNYEIHYAYGHRAGGLVGAVGATSGAVADATAIVTFENCTQAGSIWLWGRDLNGGFVAQISVGTVTFENCEMLGARIGVGNNTSGSRALGGFVGQVEATVSAFTMNNCVNKTWVYGSTGIGGFVGRNYCTKSAYNNCSNLGTEVVANANNGALYSDWGSSGIYYVGGLVGLSSSCTMTNCVNNATVKVQSNKLSDNATATNCFGFGGLVGGFTGATHIIDGCVNYGNIVTYGGQRFGGLFGSVATGAAGTFTVTDCSNFGNLTTTGGRVAGFIGYSDAQNTTYTNCVNYGDINSPNAGDCAGFFGVACRDITMENCINFGNLKIGNGAGLVALNACTSLTLNECANYGVLEILNTSAHSLEGLVFKTNNATSLTNNGSVNFAGKAAQWEGYQVRAEDGAIRLVGSIDSLKYKAVGFSIMIEYNGEFYDYNAELTNAYTSLLADGDPITATALRGNEDARLFALVIEGAPKGEMIRLYVATYAVTEAGERVMGEADVFTLTIA